MTHPLLITVDVEYAPDHDADEQRSALDRLGRLFDDLGIRATLFTTADAARRFRCELNHLAASGHEIGCHGIAHAADENYRTLSFADARRRIGTATDDIHERLGVRPRAFRGPSMTTSPRTQRALVELGYWSDFSVCSRRFDVLNSRGADVAWLWTGRRPYRPSTRSAFRRGSTPIVVVPLSGVGLPLLSGTLFTAGPRVVRSMVRSLRRRATAPIVYLLHSYEFAHRTQPTGSKVLHRVYRQSRSRRWSDTVDIISYMTDTATPMTATQFVDSTRLLPESEVA